MKRRVKNYMAVNAYFVIVLLSVVLFFVVWALGWILENLSHRLLRTVKEYGSRGWYLLVGPGVALHESSHALGCVVTRTEIVEFKPVSVQATDEGVCLGYVKYRQPSSPIKNAVINLAPVAVSLVLLVFFALGATYLVPDSHLGGQALVLLQQLIEIKANPTLLADPMYPIVMMSAFVYDFLYTFSELTVLNPLFWIVPFLAMTIMFSSAPSSVDISNAKAGLRWILVFDAIWLVIAYFVPAAGWLLYGLFEFIAVMFLLSFAFAAVGYGFFILVYGMSRLRVPLQIIPFATCIGLAIMMSYMGVGTPAFQTVTAVAAFTGVTLLLLLLSRLYAKRGK